MKKSGFLLLISLSVFFSCKKEDTSPTSNTNTTSLATLGSSTVSNIKSSTVTVTTSITSDGALSITSKGICYSTSQSPTISNSKTSDGSGSGTFVSNITNLIPSTKYFARAYATNSSGTAYGTEFTFTTSAPIIAVGEYYQGGKIFYIFQPGDLGYVAGQTHGIICSMNDQSYRQFWDCDRLHVLGTSEEIGTGKANTIASVNYCSDPNSAANVCYDLIENGYSDWYLPSIKELIKIYENKSLIGGTFENEYWSSSEEKNGIPYMVFLYSFDNGLIGSDLKNFWYYVRPVRYF